MEAEHLRNTGGSKQNSGLSVRLFVGYVLTTEMQMELAKTTLQIDSQLQRVQWKGKDYLGVYLTQGHAHIDAIRKLGKEIKSEVSALLPISLSDNTPPLVFPQLFLA